MSSLPATPSTTRRNRARLGIQNLESREVPATLVDLTFAGAQGAANGALFRQIDAGTAGADEVQTFLRVNHHGVERGYNTDARHLQFDTRRGHGATHALKLSDVPLVTVNGVAYREFLLDVSQRDRRPLISLDELRIFVAETGNLSGYDSRAHTLAGRAAVFDLDGQGNVSVILNASLNRGSGTWDATVLIPDAVFGGQQYVYLYSKFGSHQQANCGAEQWGVRPGSGPPPASNGDLSGYVYFDADNDGVREPAGNADAVPELGLEGVSVRLQGADDLGQAIDVTVVTDANGHYEFTGLRPGTYSVTKLSDPLGYFDGQNTPGVPGNGTVQESNSDPAVADMIFGISLRAGDSLSEYNFGELFAGRPH